MKTRRSRLLLGAAVVAALLLPPGPVAEAGPSVDVRNFGSAPALGAPGVALNARVVDMAAHPKSAGYWLLSADGGVFTHGAARFHGSTGGTPLNQPVVGMTPTASGAGYWFVASDGGVFTFGDARFFGSTGAVRLNRPITGMAARPDGTGYWLVGEDGGVFTFGAARFHGAVGGMPIGTTIVAIAATPSGKGYVLAGADGSLYSFGDAPLFGAAPPTPFPVVDVETTKSGKGAWLLLADGSVYTRGDAAYRGGANPTPFAGVALARTPDGAGYWLALGPRLPSPPANSGSGRRIVYSNSMQRVWLVEANEMVAHSWLVSGRRGVPSPGTYHVFSKSAMSSAHGGSLRLPYMTRFAHGRTLSIGFHGIPLRSNGTPIQSDAELGSYRSSGCVRMNQDAARTLFEWSPIGTTVVVLP